MGWQVRAGKVIEQGKLHAMNLGSPGKAIPDGKVPIFEVVTRTKDKYKGSDLNRYNSEFPAVL